MVALERDDSAFATGRVREVVAVFDDPDCLDGAVADLQSSGFNRADLSIASGERALLAKLGRSCSDVREIEDDPAVPRTVFVSKASLGDAEGVLIGVAVYVGAVVAAAIAAEAGAGMWGIILAVAITAAITGLIGAFLVMRLDRRYRADIREQVQRGGFVLWVNLHSPEQEQRALQVLESCNAKRIHVHEVPAL